MRRQERDIQSVDSMTKTALTDLDALMVRAREAISVVQRYAAYSASDPQQTSSIHGSDDSSRGGDSASASNSNSSMSETTSQAMERNEMESIMQSIGIVSPVTKFSAGRQYHQQLARQIADILLQQRRLERLGSMITLPDLYCLLNRARGTELVSPEDLLRAAELTGRMHLGVSLKVYASGVKLLQLDSVSEEDIGLRILELLRTDAEYGSRGIQASELALRLNLSLIVSKEQLQVAEKNQLLCRDETIEGIFFYTNRFREYCKE